MLLGTYTFPAFLVGDGMLDLRKVRSAARPQAERQQRRVARQRRDVLRELLRSAARMGALQWGTVYIADFAESGVVQAPVFVNLDEDLPGDSEFNRICLDGTAGTAAATNVTGVTFSAPEAVAADKQGLLVWLVLESRPTSVLEVGTVVACHSGLLTWGRATVQELECTREGALSTNRFLCVEGRWRPLGIGHIEWQPTGRGDALVFGSADGPVLDPEVPRLLTFEDPVLEDRSHSHAFIFTSKDVRCTAAQMLESM